MAADGWQLCPPARRGTVLLVVAGALLALLVTMVFYARIRMPEPEVAPPKGSGTALYSRSPAATGALPDSEPDAAPAADLSTGLAATPSPERVNAVSEVYLPAISGGEAAGATPVPRTPAAKAAPRTATPTSTPFPTIDFAVVRAELQASGQDLGTAKIGFHVSVGGNERGLGEWMRRLDEAGVPFFLKSVDYAGPLYEAQGLVQSSGVPHTLVFRSTDGVPNYDLPPEEAARLHWEQHRSLFPPELDPSLVWLETVNEIDKNRSEWLALFSLATAQMTLDAGFRWAAFGWSTGEPEPEDWQSPAMLDFLRLAGEHPDRLAVAVHEYSLTRDDIAAQYPFRVGRFLRLFQVCDQHGIPRPTILITEWGWVYNDVPSVNEAMRDIAWTSALYAPFPEVKGAAIWYLGGGYGGIADRAQRLIAPVMEYSLTSYFVVPLAPARASLDAEPHRQ